MSREAHVRFCEKLKGEVPFSLLDLLLRASLRLLKLNGYTQKVMPINSRPSSQSFSGLKAGIIEKEDTQP